VRDRQKPRPELGERDLARGALEQPEPELRLELAHQNAHPGLSDEKALRRAREALVARGEQKGFELARSDIHGNATRAERKSAPDGGGTARRVLPNAYGALGLHLPPSPGWLQTSLPTACWISASRSAASR